MQNPLKHEFAGTIFEVVFLNVRAPQCCMPVLMCSSEKPLHAIVSSAEALRAPCLAINILITHFIERKTSVLFYFIMTIYSIIV